MRRYNPWEELMRMHDELDKIFGDFTMPTFSRPQLNDKRPKGTELQTYYEPPSDVIEKGDSYQVIVDLPGIEKENLSVVVHEKTVEIKAEKKEDISEEREGYFVHERGYVGYARSIPLPKEVIPNETRAIYNNGVLELTIKKKESDTKKSFKVDL